MPYVRMILGIFWFCDNAKLVEPTGYSRDLYGWAPDCILRHQGHPHSALLQLREPMNKFPDFVHYIVQHLKTLSPAMGKVKITETLARAGLHLGISAECPSGGHLEASALRRWQPTAASTSQLPCKHGRKLSLDQYTACWWRLSQPARVITRRCKCCRT